MKPTTNLCYAAWNGKPHLPNVTRERDRNCYRATRNRNPNGTMPTGNGNTNCTRPPENGNTNCTLSCAAFRRSL